MPQVELQRLWAAIPFWLVTGRVSCPGAAGRWRKGGREGATDWDSQRLWDGCGFAAPLSFGESGENGEQAGGLRILFA